MRSPLLRTLASALLAVAVAVGGPRPSAQVTPPSYDQGAIGLGLALRHLPNDVSVLMITAHPDDEDNGLLVRLSRGLGIKTSLLTLTRGDGGQNEIGRELFQALGVLRTEELATMHRLDGVEQYFTRAYEFGYSFSDDETFRKWGREEILDDVVRVVRRVRPDVILTMPREAGGGGRHHQASAQLAHEAFHAAADPARFADQLKDGLAPWRTRKSYEMVFDEKTRGLSIELGQFDPLLGMSWHQLGALARMSHLCQGMSQLMAAPGTARRTYSLVNGRVGDGEKDILDGIDVSVARLAGFVQEEEATVPFLGAGLASIVNHARAAAASFDVRAPHLTLTPLAAGLTATRTLTRQVEGSSLGGQARAELLWRLARKEQDFVKAVTLARGIVVRALVDDGDVVRGQTFAVTTNVYNTGTTPVMVDDVTLRTPPGWTVTRTKGDPGTLDANGTLSITYAVTVSRDARYAQPYWTLKPGVDRFDVAIPEHHTKPWSPPDVMAEVRYSAAGVQARVEQPAYFRYERPPVAGEHQKVVNVVPALSVRASPDVAIVPARGTDRRREFRIAVLNNAKRGGDAAVRLEAPRGWSVTPGEVVLPFRREGEELTARFEVSAPEAAGEGEETIRAVATRDGEAFREGYQVIAYDHIQSRHLFHPAQSRVKLIDVTVPAGVSVGYVMGSGDDVPVAIEQLGVRVTPLAPDDIAFADLTRFSTIVTGIRAYEKRADLRAYNQRLLEFVRGGGHLVVQYNKVEANDANPFPFAGAITRNRVTVEDAPVRLLVPGAPELTTPNRIASRDFEGWVQERGLYFFGAADSRYVDLLASSDPWPDNPGEKKGLLTVATFGRGTWTYVGLGLWRQLPAGTPGAYRLLANLIGRTRR